MSDTKRQSNAAGKVPVAIPNIGPSGIIPLENALSGVIGARIRIVTNIPSEPTIEGTLFSACPVTNLLAISTSSSQTYQVIPISVVHSFTLLSAPPGSCPPSFSTANPSIAPVSTAPLLSRANAAVARLQEAAARKNKSVGKDAQELFDALSRTLPTKWDGTSIEVMDAVVISSPYRSEDCKAKAGQQPAVLGRVKKVLENERKRLIERSNKVVPAVPAIPAVQRKGG